MRPLRALLIVGVFGAGAIAGAVALTPASAEDSESTNSSATHRPHPGPGHGFAHLTDTQRDCLEAAGLTRPATRPSGPPTQEQIQKFRDAATSCGVELPAGPERMGPGGPDHMGPVGPGAAASSQ